MEVVYTIYIYNHLFYSHPPRQIPGFASVDPSRKKSQSYHLQMVCSMFIHS